jgi:hypothetical protein
MRPLSLPSNLLVFVSWAARELFLLVIVVPCMSLYSGTLHQPEKVCHRANYGSIQRNQIRRYNSTRQGASPACTQWEADRQQALQDIFLTYIHHIHLLSEAWSYTKYSDKRSRRISERSRAAWKRLVTLDSSCTIGVGAYWVSLIEEDYSRQDADAYQGMLSS